MASGSDESSDVTVLENRASALPRSGYDGIHHGPGQVVGSNHLIGEQQPKRRVDRSQQAVTEIRFLARLHGVDVCGPEEGIYSASKFALEGYTEALRLEVKPFNINEERFGCVIYETCHLSGSSARPIQLSMIY
jgi:hypothetical protein